MRRARYGLGLLLVLGALALLAPAGALASGCGAGDSQYVDPLQNCGSTSAPNGGSNGGGPTSHPTSGSTPSSSPSGSSTPTSPSTGTSPATSASSPSTSTTGTTATTTGTSTTSSGRDPSSSQTLPFTGLDLGPALLLAVGLLSGGLALRRVAAGGERR